MHQALYRKYRSATFDEVYGQEHITSVLSWEVANNKVSHAYLFCGSRGTGKTSCAKILAKAVNCENPVNGNPCNKCESCKAIDSGASVEVLEMDAASNTGVDYIREIRDEVLFTPSESGTKVYIIDEVHMLSEGAFNALLKTLEEPPANVIFILATTELQEIPATIISRCQRFDFRRLSNDNIIARLEYIAEHESISLEREAARLIAKLSQGGMRDAVSLLELCTDQNGNVTVQTVRDAAGICGRESVITVIEAIVSGDCAAIFEEVSKNYISSKDMSVFFADLMNYYRDMLVQKTLNITNLDGTNKDIIDVSENELHEIMSLASHFTKEKLVYHSKLLEEAYINMSRSNSKRIIAEITLVRMCSDKYDNSYEGIAARIASLENKISSGEIAFSSSDNSTVRPVKETKITNKEQTDNKSETEISATNGGTPLADWIETVEKYSGIDASSVPFLKDTSAYINDKNQLVVEVDDSFSKAMLVNSNAEKTLLNLVRNNGTDVDEVVITITQKKESAPSLFDDLI